LGHSVAQIAVFEGLAVDVLQAGTLFEDHLVWRQELVGAVTIVAAIVGAGIAVITPATGAAAAVIPALGPLAGGQAAQVVGAHPALVAANLPAGLPLAPAGMVLSADGEITALAATAPAAVIAAFLALTKGRTFPGQVAHAVGTRGPVINPGKLRGREVRFGPGVRKGAPGALGPGGAIGRGHLRACAALGAIGQTCGASGRGLAIGRRTLVTLLVVLALITGRIADEKDEERGHGQGQRCVAMGN